MHNCDSSLPARRALAIVYRRPGALRPYQNNARTHSPEQVEKIAASILEFGFTNPILLKDDDETIGAGHGRHAAAELILSRGQALPTPDGETVPTITLTGLTEVQWRAYVLADNKLALNAGWDEGLLAAELAAIAAEAPDLTAVAGFDTSDLERLLAEAVETPSTPAHGSLAERFLGIPFTVLNARDGWWQDRKRAWLSLGIQSELGRGDNALGFSETVLSNGRKPASAVPGGGGGGAWLDLGAKGKRSRKARTFGQDLMRGEHTVGGDRR